MRVECVANKGSQIPAEVIDSHGTSETEFSVRIGDTYIVYAMQIRKGVLNILLSDEEGFPEWNPMILFTVNNPKVPEHWEFASFLGHCNEVELRRKEIGEKWGFQPDDTARWGYPEIVNSDTHYLGLIEHEPEDLRIFHLEQQRNFDS